MSDSAFKIAIIGSGPAGVSAGGHAAELGISHILLEGTPEFANTIQRYQKGKHVMCEPSVLPLRSPLPFQDGKREEVLKGWGDGLEKHKVNIRYGAEVTQVSGQEGDFTITLGNGDVITAEYVIMGIGLQGNPRKMGCPGEDEGYVQYTLDDPDEYNNETIFVIGAGDAAIENAIALAKNNRVIIVNRRDEFARAKEGNLNDILAAIEDGVLECMYEASANRIEKGGETCSFVLNTKTGEVAVDAHRIIARLGASPPRAFVESTGIEFPNASAEALPALSSTYESNVPGMYVIGALGGYPLIKQAMNQGYEVVEYIEGNDIEPVENPLLKEMFKNIPDGDNVDGVLDRMQGDIPIYAEINRLMFRQLLLDSDVHTPAEDDVVFLKNDYSSSFYAILQGSVWVVLDEATDFRIELHKGSFFGEMALVSGRRRNATIIAGKDCIMVETPRRTMKKLLSSVDSVKDILDQAFIVRALQGSFGTGWSPLVVETAKHATLQQFTAGEEIYREGSDADMVYLIRSGSVVVSKQVGGSDTVLTHLSAGNYVGETGMLTGGKHTESIKTAIATEAICLNKETFINLFENDEAVESSVRATLKERMFKNTQFATSSGGGDKLSFMMRQGLGEATNVLVIDSGLCVGCDNCVDACADTHFGISRLNREAGASFENLHIPISCRHCEQPHCMKDCPADAIHRSNDGEVYIADNCIACGNCERNCPYDVIKIAKLVKPKPGFNILSFLKGGSDDEPKKSAVKCDQCMNLSRGPACVRACPTGAAKRVDASQFMDVAQS